MKQLLTASALALSLVLSPVAYAREEGNASKTMQSSPNATKAPYDIQFLDTMAEHHRQGIQMFQMAVDKAQSQELRNKAQMMIDNQQKEIPELASMREDVKADAPEAINMKLPGMMPQDKMEKEMAKLEAASGSDFDHRFIDMVNKHHQGAIEMSKAELKSGKNQAAKNKAQEIIDKQSREITELKRMLSSIK